MFLFSDVLLSPEVLKVKTPSKFYRKRTRSPSPTEEAFLSIQSTPAMIVPMGTPTQRVSRKSMFEGLKNRLSRKCLFEGKVEDTPKTNVLKKTASILIKKNQAQRSQIGRLRAKTKMHKSLKSADFQTEFSKTLAMMQLRKKKTKKEWTNEEKNLCLSLHYKSPATYNFLRQQGLVLAAPSTIRKWLTKSNCLPGLVSDVFKNIQKRFENASIKEKACVLCFDEMSIMSSLEYSKKYDIIEGFEDLGGNRRCNKIAKNCLVFLIRGLYGQWKLPVAYFLSHTNVKAENLELLLKAIINKLFDTGVLPKVVVCDQASTNQNVFKRLGVTSKHPFFFCNNRKLFALYDVPHLIKNIRNNFLLNDYVNGEENMSFQDIRSTYNIDKASNVSRSLTKLTERHMNPNAFQKMTVSLATQVFSNSVAAAIRTAKETKELTSDTADATAKFVQVVNHMFDALNSRKRYDKNPYKNALSEKSSFVNRALIDAKKIFENLQKISYRNKDGQRKKILTRPPCFDGVVLTIEAVLQFYGEECSDKNSYIITKKLNQDIIENLFARFRQKGGYNRNPTAKVLRTIFRSNLVNSFIKLPKSKNCEDEGGNYLQLPIGIPVADYTSSDSYDCDDTRIPEQSEFEAAAISSSDVADEMAAASTSTTGTRTVTLEECSITYFAGYLGRSSTNKYKCQRCTENLFQDISLDDPKQILILNKTYDCSNSVGLKMPSDNLLKLVQLAIDCFNKHFKSNIHCKKIKLRLFKTILNFLRCNAPELLNISCENQLLFIINHLILVKIHFACKSTKNTYVKTSKGDPKLRILQNK